MTSNPSRRQLHSHASAEMTQPMRKKLIEVAQMVCSHATAIVESYAVCRYCR